MAETLLYTNQAAVVSAIAAVLKSNKRRFQILEDEEKQDMDHLCTLQGLIASTVNINERTVWRFPTTNDWWSRVYPNLTDELFISHFRVDRMTFAWLVSEVRDSMTTQDTTFREATTVERKVAVSLKCLATTCDMLTTAALFGIGKSSAQKYFLQFIETMYVKVVPKMIKFPSHEDIRKIGAEFEQMWGFPMAAGAIDGTHIPFNPPTNLVTDFHNYKGWNSILALAICDGRGRVLWLKSGMPGRQSDSGAFKSTSCYVKLSNGELLPRDTKTILNERIPYMILGDSGFAMEPWLIKPFTHHGMMTENQKMFNFRHSRARRAVENLFGRVKMRWRRLLRGLDVKYENAHKVISVAFALHNICEASNLVCTETPEERSENAVLRGRNPQPVSVSHRDNFSGINQRNTLMEYFSQQPNPWTGS